MKKIYHKFLIISTIFLLLGGVYLYFSSELNSKGVIPVAFGSSLASTTGDAAPLVTTTAEDKISSDISFLATIEALKNIKIDVSLFSSRSFNMLENNSVKIEPVTAGRVNPFAPINSVNIVNAEILQKVVTNLPTQVTNNAAILNGTVNAVVGVTDTYFEYGITPNLGTTTTIVKQSLVGTFIKNVLGLTPKTNYFFKACAKINNVALCGEVVSFTTN